MKLKGMTIKYNKDFSVKVLEENNTHALLLFPDGGKICVLKSGLEVNQTLTQSQ